MVTQYISFTNANPSAVDLFALLENQFMEYVATPSNSKHLMGTYLTF
jgi:hypothetical protein